jgi:hypothetical protein
MTDGYEAVYRARLGGADTSGGDEQVTEEHDDVSGVVAPDPPVARREGRPAAAVGEH